MAISKRTGRPVKGGRIGDIHLVRNLLSMREVENMANIHEEGCWYHLRAQFEDGTESNLLFTRTEILRALKRARENPEDVPKTNPIRDALD